MLSSALAMSASMTMSWRLQNCRRQSWRRRVAAAAVSEARASAASASISGRACGPQARELDAARTDAVHAAERNATEIERINQYRLLHDSVLQVREAVPGSWNVASDLLVRRTDFEVERLSRVLSGGGLVPERGLIEAAEHLFRRGM